MPGLSSPYRPSGALGRQRSTSPLPPPVPAKTIDLNSSTRSTDRETGSKITRRAFLCDVVVEREGEETANLLQHLGRPLAPLSTLPVPAPPNTIRPVTPSRSRSQGLDEGDPDGLWNKEKQAEMAARLGNLIEELVKTERSYLMRIQALKKSYADPLRKFAKEEMSKIIPLYEAKTLFTNIDAIVPAAAVFLADLEAMYDSGQGASTVGDVCLRHLRDLRTLDPYRTYLGKQDESQKTLQDVSRRYSSFGSYIERTKYSTLGIGNIGLRELLMEPVQRIPRYTLLWSTMIKCLPPLSSQRTKLQQCIEIASRIAKCEPDPQTVRATVMYCLERNVDGFPANLFSNNRDFIDSIDVDDMPAEYPTNASPGSRLSSRPMSVISASTSASTPSLASFGSSASSTQLPMSPQSNVGGASNGLTPLHCSLFLFDDKLMIVKRQSSSISGRKVTGLDDVQKLVKSGGGVAVMNKDGSKKDKLSYRGVVDVLDIIATDVGNGDFHLFFERPPNDQGDRWSSRPFRSYNTVSPPFGNTIDPVTIRRDKLRFLQNLWAAQAQARAKVLPKEMDTKAVPRVMVSNDETGLDAAGEVFGRAQCYWNIWDRPGWTAENRKAKVAIHIDEDDLAPELSLHEGDPCLVIKIQPMSGGLCRFSYATAANDGEARVLIDISEVEERIVTTIHRYGVFKFRTSANSCPTTPSSTGHRLRPSMLNLDMISRNLFGQGSISGKSNTSSDMFSTSSTRRKAMSRTSTIDTGRFSSSSDRSDERKISRGSSSPGSQMLEEGLPPRPYNGRGMGQSEIDLNERLNIARKNSKTMAALSPAKARLGAKSVAELRSQVEDRAGDDVKRGRMGARSVGDLRRGENDIEEAMGEAVRSGSPTPMSPTAPLTIRNKSPSPTKSMAGTPRALPNPIAVPPKYSQDKLDSMYGRSQSPSVEQVLSTALPTLPTFGSPFGPLSVGPERRDMPHSPVDPLIATIDTVLETTTTTSTSYTVATSPRQIGSPTPGGGNTAPLSPRPLGPRSPTIRSPPTGIAAGLGSAHTKLRIVSGNGRRVSVGRETIPLKGMEESDSPESNNTTPTIFLSKRQHSEDHLTPRKRSPTRSPLNPLIAREDAAQVAEPLRVPSSGTSAKKVQPRRVSGHNTPKERSSHRRVSGANSVASQGSVTPSMSSSIRDSTFSTHTTAGNPTAYVEYESVTDAVDAAKRKIADGRAGVKRLKIEVQSLRKQLSHGGGWLGGDGGTSRGYSQGSLPRSPHRRNIHRLVDIDDTPPASRILNGSGKHELDTMLLDETARGLAALVEKVDGVLKGAIGDGEQAGTLAVKLAGQLAEREMEVKSLQAQVLRGKENQELLREQLADVQVEVDVIYEAFNTELDGMFNDTQLPPTEAFEAMRRDLQDAKSARNDLALENARLKRELEEANLKREQWAKILRERGVL